MKKIFDSKIFKTLSLIIRTIVWIFVITIVGVIVIQRVFNNNVSVGGFRIFTIITESMKPEYEVFDVVVSKKKDVSEIKKGDDIVYLGKEKDFKDKIVTHRVLWIETVDGKPVFHTKGIANSIEDPLVYGDQIYGVVVMKATILSFISKVINNPYGFYFLILVPIAILISLEIIDRGKKEE